LIDYVQKIRQKIGHDLLMLQGASVLAFDDAGRVLLGQSAQGIWSTIGGAIEPGESPAEAAVREFWEEAGALIHVVRVLGVFGGPEFFTTYPNGDEVAYTSIAFEARVISGALRPDQNEMTKLEWFHSSEVDALQMTAANRIVLTMALAGRTHPIHRRLEGWFAWDRPPSPELLRRAAVAWANCH
jgi:8-oxo-dGTP pyrophosphatase MutT (NUDIX family)